MIESKVCTMCGREQSVDNYRKYPKGDKSRPYCKECEAIEVRRRYLSSLSRQDKLTTEQRAELVSIYQLYEARRDAGLRTFGMRSKRGPGDTCRLIEGQMHDLMTRKIEQLGNDGHK